MNREDVPKDLQGVYAPKPGFPYRGLAEGGPEDGKELVGDSLTKFIARTLPRPYAGYGFFNLGTMTEEQLEQQRRMDREILAETVKARSSPHRYDFDIDTGIWKYVEYKPGELQ